MASALLFPGQGSQEPGMGRDAAEHDIRIMNLWKKAERLSGLDLRAIYWEGSEADMAATASLQPGLTTANLAFWTLLSERFKPTATAGHSLGEYSALAAAGVLGEDAVLQLVTLRGRLMSQADPEGTGGMAAVVKLPLAAVQALIDESQKESGEMLLLANYNTPGQFVASGARGAIALLTDKVKAAKGRAISLAVSGAFHSPLMAEAGAELASAIDALPKTAWNKARFPIYCNAAPHPQTDPDIIKDLLKRQMTSPVYWIDSIRRQWDAGCRLFVECGPKGVLGKMVGPILKEYVTAALPDAEESPWTVANVGNLRQALDFQQ
ncbi:ACP S-malonyltransferase [Desulfovibrio sp. OttesenSCG-928-M16]|nr:ACP S-malonyltransferase [Desulfovibrio sp. OttesenSCG-928-M16]